MARRAARSPLAFLGVRPVLTSVLGACAIAFSGIFVALADASPVTASAFRTFYALPALGALAWIERRRFGPRPRRAHRLAVVAGIAFAADLILWHHSVDAVGAGLATVLGNLQVVVVGILAWMVLGESMDRRLIAAIPIVVAGAVLVSGVIGSEPFGDDPALGVITGVGTSLAYAIFILVHREGARDLRRPAGPLFEASAVTAIVSVLWGIGDGTVSVVPSWPSHGWLLALALTGQVVGWLLLSISLPRLPAALSSVLLLIQPVGALVLGAVILGEDPSAVQFGGVALILAGVFMAARRRGGPIPTEPPAAIPEPATP